VDRAEKEIKRQYTSRGFYGAKVTVTVTPLERNRVALRIDIEEGEVTKIADINIIGAKDFTERQLLREMKLTTPGWFTWFTKDDQYSKQQLTADLEALRSYYLNRGYLEFNIEATQVSITPDREKIYITIVITEGPVFRLGDVKFSGDLIVKEPELRALTTVQPGDIFSREKIVETTKRITDRLGNEGYSFANVNPVPELDRDKRVAGFTFFIDPGRRVYVRPREHRRQPEDAGRGHSPRAAPARIVVVFAREDRPLEGAPAAHRLLLRGELRDAGRARDDRPGGREHHRSPSATRARSTSASGYSERRSSRSRPRSRRRTSSAPATWSPSS
jgi:hemolysin activation/secretion protein